MKTTRVDSIKNYLSPVAPLWAQVLSVQIPMMPTPQPMQPTDYIRRSWENKPYGQTTALELASVHDGETWAVRASWKGSDPGTFNFPDALAVALPVRNSPVLALMGGSKDSPIHILRWAANKEGVTSLLATGIGLSVPGPTLKCMAQAAAEKQTWHVVISRALGADKDVAPLEAGKKTRVGFALWRGDNDERAGIKAFSIDWTELVLDA